MVKQCVCLRYFVINYNLYVSVESRVCFYFNCILNT